MGDVLLEEKMDSLNVYSLFAVPFAQAMLPNHESINTALRALILAREKLPQQFSNPNPAMAIPEGLFESTFDFFASSEPEIQTLKVFCFRRLQEVLAALNQQSDADIAALSLHSHTWFHVTRDGAYFSAHNHPMASWSGVYCVDPGDITEDKQSGAISFQNPIAGSAMFLDDANSRTKLPFSGKNFSMQLRAGEVVLFPSYLIHQVLPYRGLRERITIAFNCWFSKANP
jgi:uncharacterized protein (TIGR02466 family)